MRGAWAGQPQWRILETRFANGLNFLATWRAWKDDPQRPRILHFVSIADNVDIDDIDELAGPLASACHGLLPGVHRLAFERGQVLLTLCIGERDRMLREMEFHADAVILNDAASNLKVLARRCRRGTSISVQHADDARVGSLRRHGFAMPPRGDGCATGVFAPAWEPRGPKPKDHVVPGDCIVIGAGLAGAAAAASLARRGWRVRVLDAAHAPASGASALPAGLLVPQGSPDDNLLSRLSRDGVRATLQQAHLLLQSGRDWEQSGVLEHHVDGLPIRQDVTAQSAAWSRPADARQKRAAGLDRNAPAEWHEKAGWIQPAALVRAWLAQPGVQLQTGATLATLRRQGARWQALDAAGDVLAQGELVVVAAAYATQALVPQVKLQAVRGQVSWALRAGDLELPPFPVNGDGGFIPFVPTPAGPAWLCGSSFDRDDLDMAAREADHHENLSRLRRMLPQAARQLEAAFADGSVKAWSGIRCASTDRRPLVGPVDEEGAKGLWVSTAMGSRGLTFAALCGELVAARLHGEPLPIARNLARALSVERQTKNSAHPSGSRAKARE